MSRAAGLWKSAKRRGFVGFPPLFECLEFGLAVMKSVRLLLLLLSSSHSAPPPIPPPTHTPFLSLVGGVVVAKVCVCLPVFLWVFFQFSRPVKRLESRSMSLLSLRHFAGCPCTDVWSYQTCFISSVRCTRLFRLHDCLPLWTREGGGGPGVTGDRFVRGCSPHM